MIYIIGKDFVSKYKASKGILGWADKIPLSNASSTFSNIIISFPSVPCQASELNKIPDINIACLNLSPASTFQCASGISFKIAKIFEVIP